MRKTGHSYYTTYIFTLWNSDRLLMMTLSWKCINVTDGQKLGDSLFVLLFTFVIFDQLINTIVWICNEFP